MEHQLCVLLYSKYSPNSDKLMEIISVAPVNIMYVAQIKLLCIDNEDIRTKIIKSSKINIQSVPCVLIVFPDGGVEKYEGITAFKWMDEIISKHTPTQPVYKEPIEQVVETVKPLVVDNRKRKAHKTSRKTSRKSKSDIEEFTSISDLDDEHVDNYDDSDQESDTNIKPKSTGSHSANYELDSDFEEVKEPKPKVSKSTNIMAVAMAMQKNRESGNNIKPK
jgi:hypothetical protein